MDGPRRRTRSPRRAQAPQPPPSHAGEQKPEEEEPSQTEEEGASEGDDSDSDNELKEPKRKASASAVNMHIPSAPTAEEQDAAYQQARTTTAAWPHIINQKGKLKDMPYNGTGWWFHFCNPQKPRTPIGMPDVERIRAFLIKRGKLELDKPEVKSAGVIQMKIGFGKGQNLQFYTTRHGLSQGNVKLAIGTKESLIPVRQAVLESAWFHDAQVGASTPFSPKADVAYQKEGKMILPPLHSGTETKDLKTILQSVKDKLGEAGKAAMRKYLEGSGLNPETEAAQLLSEIFGAASTKAEKKKKD